MARKPGRAPSEGLPTVPSPSGTSLPSSWHSHPSCSFSRGPGETKLLAKEEGRSLCRQGEGLGGEGSRRAPECPEEAVTPGRTRQGTLLLDSSQWSPLPDSFPGLPEQGWVSFCSYSHTWCCLLSFWVCVPGPGLLRPRAPHQCSLFTRLPNQGVGPQVCRQDLEEVSEQGAAPSPIWTAPPPPGWGAAS